MEGESRGDGMDHGELMMCGAELAVGCGVPERDEHTNTGTKDVYS
jgi:hypothetical protein